MPNTSGDAYALTTFCPIKQGNLDGGESYSSVTRKVLQNLLTDEKSPMSQVPNTYLARFFILDNAIFQSFPFELDQLRSQYMVFTCNLYGDLDEYLKGMWNNMKSEIERIWAHCVGFETVKDSFSFITYVRKCQVNTTFYFNGSTDDPLQEQLKSLFLKQEFSKFVFAHQGIPAEQLLIDFKAFIRETNAMALTPPTWRPGASSLESAVYRVAPTVKKVVV